MPKMSDRDLKALLQSEKSDAAASSKLIRERSDAMDYYMGDMFKDMPAAEGRSKAVSSDVSDTIEGLMPGLMEIFAGSDEVVRFDPVSSEDIQAAEQETMVVNHVFMQLNDGFLVLYSMIKDALLSKLGVAKVWSEEEETDERETYLGLSDDELAQLLSDPDIELIERSEHEPEEGSDVPATAPY